MRFFHSHKKTLGPPDWILVGIMMLLSLFGLLMVYDSSVSIAVRDFGNQYYFLTEQLKWLAIGCVVYFFMAFTDYKIWKKLALPGLIATMLLLLVVFVPGVGIKALGAKRWINFGFFVLQPAELAKMSLIVYLSTWLSEKNTKKLIPFLIILGIILFLVTLEPDLGTAVILLVSALSMYFYSGAPLAHFILFIPIVVLGFGGLSVFSPYRFQRILTFFNPEHDPLGASYHIRQALIALGSGGLFGIGIGQSRQKYEYLPEANTDSIFAIIGEELGFVGGAILILLFIVIIWRGFAIARRTEDPFGRLLALGITTWIAFQVIINISAMVALMFIMT